MITNGPNQKYAGYDRRGVGNGCLLCEVRFDIVQTQDSKID